MVHAFSELGFTLVAIAAAGLIWTMLSGYRSAIAAALGLTSVAPLPRVAGRRIRVRSAQPSTLRAVPRRRAA